MLIIAKFKIFKASKPYGLFWLTLFFQRMNDRVYGVHKIHSNYGRVFSEWSGIEKEMADGLQTAGHYMDV